MGMGPFIPMFILPTELQDFDLPTPDNDSSILDTVKMASALIDEACGRVDGDGNGSLVFTTYIQRILLQARNRNLFMFPMKPLTPVDATTVAQLQALAAAAGPSGNFFYTGVLANTLPGANVPLSAIVSASGRYGYVRQDTSIGYPDLWAFINPLNLVTMFGGPAPWVAMDVTNTDYNPQTGECWPPAGLQLQRYSEVLMTYNSGFHPLKMPWQIKHVCASIVKNLLPRGGATAMMNMSLSRSGVNMGFTQNLIDPTLDQMLAAFKNVRAY